MNLTMFDHVSKNQEKNWKNDEQRNFDELLGVHGIKAMSWVFDIYSK